MFLMANSNLGVSPLGLHRNNMLRKSILLLTDITHRNFSKEPSPTASNKTRKQSRTHTSPGISSNGDKEDITAGEGVPVMPSAIVTSSHDCH
jgi:hypothetical protein